MKKLFSTLLAAALVAGSALSVSAGMFVYDESDGEYWDAALNMLDKTQKAFWLEDGSAAADWSYSVDANSTEYEAHKLANLQSGWYEVILCNLGTNAEWFPAEVEGKVALTVRGDSTFTVKSENAKNAGAIACLVANNCRPEELVDETGTVTTGTYQVTNMTVEYETLPMGMVSSDVTVRLVAATADITIAEAVEAVTATANGALDLGLEHKKSAWLYLGTEEEYKANTTRTDANTVTGAGAAAATTAAETITETTTTETAAAVSIEIVPQDYPGTDPIANSGAGYATLDEAVAAIGKTAITGYTYVNGTASHANEGPEKLWDNDTATKFCTATFPTISIAELDGEYAIDGIIMATANDNAEYNNRSPYEWAVYGSGDGATWTALAYGDDYFFEETNFTYYAAPLTTEGTYKYVMFQSEGGLSGTFQVSELVLCGTKVEAAAPVEEVVEEAPVAEEPVVEEPVVVEETVEETVVEEAVVEETVEAAEEEAAQTFDFGVIAAVAAVVSAAGYAISKKR